jgi:hypothetical protein
MNQEDILWRRSKLGLHAPDGTSDRLEAWLGRRAAGPAGRKREAAA